MANSFDKGIPNNELWEIFNRSMTIIKLDEFKGEFSEMRKQFLELEKSISKVNSDKEIYVNRIEKLEGEVYEMRKQFRELEKSISKDDTKIKLFENRTDNLAIEVEKIRVSTRWHLFVLLTLAASFIGIVLKL